MHKGPFVANLYNEAQKSVLNNIHQSQKLICFKVPKLSLEAGQETDNLSTSEIIQQRLKKNVNSKSLRNSDTTELKQPNADLVQKPTKV